MFWPTAHVVDADIDQNSDLWQALKEALATRGSSLLPLCTWLMNGTNMWGGLAFSNSSSADETIDLYVNLVERDYENNIPKILSWL